MARRTRQPLPGSEIVPVTWWWCMDCDRRLWARAPLSVGDLLWVHLRIAHGGRPARGRWKLICRVIRPPRADRPGPVSAADGKGGGRRLDKR